MVDPVQPYGSQRTPVKRPPGEIGGHTVQPEEQPDPSGALDTSKSPTSRDTPAPTTAEEGRRDSPGSKRLEEPTVPAATRGSSAQSKQGKGSELARPAGHSASSTGSTDAPDPKPSLRMKQGGGAGGAAGATGLDKEELVEHITASLAEMLARALRQSVEQGVEKAMAGQSAQGPGPAATQSAHRAEMEKPRPGLDQSRMENPRQW